MGDRRRPGCGACLGRVSLGCAAVALVSAATLWSVAHFIRKEVEDRYRTTVGSLNGDRAAMEPLDPTLNSVYWLRAAVHDLTWLETIDPEAKRLSELPPAQWTAADQSWIREQAGRLSPAFEALAHAASAPGIDFDLDLRGISLGNAEPDNLLHHVRLARVSSLAGREALTRGDPGAAADRARGLLGSARTLAHAPLELYRLIGASTERRGLSLVRESLNDLSDKQTRELAALVVQLASTPDRVELGRSDVLAFYYGGIERVGLPFIPHDLVRALWLRCEVEFAQRMRGDLESMRAYAERLRRSSYPTDAMCRGFVDDRLRSTIHDAVMQRVRELAIAAIHARLGTEDGPARDRARARRVLRLPVNDLQVVRRADGRVTVSDPAVDQVAAILDNEVVEPSIRELSVWTVVPLRP